MSEFVTLSAGLLLALSIPMISWMDVSGGGIVVAGQGPLALVLHLHFPAINSCKGLSAWITCIWKLETT